MRDESPEKLELSMDRLGDLFDEGVSASDFWALFVQCANCGFVMPRYLYPFAHQCPKRLKAIENLRASQEGEKVSDRSQERESTEVPSPPAPIDSSESGWDSADLDVDGSVLMSDDDDDLPDFLTVLAGLRNSTGSSSR